MCTALCPLFSFSVHCILTRDWHPAPFVREIRPHKEQLSWSLCSLLPPPTDCFAGADTGYRGLELDTSCVEPGVPHLPPKPTRQPLPPHSPFCKQHQPWPKPQESSHIPLPSPLAVHPLSRPAGGRAVWRGVLEQAAAAPVQRWGHGEVTQPLWSSIFSAVRK